MNEDINNTFPQTTQLFQSSLVRKLRHARLDILPVPRENLVQNRNKHTN